MGLCDIKQIMNINDSTCQKVHPKYSHGPGSDIETTPKDRLYYCPDKKDVPNPMHGSEFRQHVLNCKPCQERMYGNKDAQRKKKK